MTTQVCNMAISTTKEPEKYILPNGQIFEPEQAITLDIDRIATMKQKIRDILEFDTSDIPNDIKIATMTLEGRFKTIFYPWNIYKYMKLRSDGIIKVVKVQKKQKKCDINETIQVKELNVRSFDKPIDIIDIIDITDISDIKSDTIPNKYSYKKNQPIKKIKKGNQSKNRQSDVFLNQVTVSIIVSNKKNPVSVKIFSNGTVHFTGCVSLDNMFEATYKLCIECSQNVSVIGEGRKIKRVKFVRDPDDLRVEYLTDIKVDMINCIFVVPFKIDRPKFQVLMKADGYNASYDSNGHAGVKIKYVSSGKKITIFVFEAGSIIIILGKQGFRRIREIYNFIYKYILENYESIVKTDEITSSIIHKYVQREKQKRIMISQSLDSIQSKSHEDLDIHNTNTQSISYIANILDDVDYINDTCESSNNNIYESSNNNTTIITGSNKLRIGKSIKNKSDKLNYIDLEKICQNKSY
jgi:hypothetical protein